MKHIKLCWVGLTELRAWISLETTRSRLAISEEMEYNLLYDNGLAYRIYRFADAITYYEGLSTVQFQSS